MPKNISERKSGSGYEGMGYEHRRPFIVIEQIMIVLEDVALICHGSEAVDTRQDFRSQIR